MRIAALCLLGSVVFIVSMQGFASVGVKSDCVADDTTYYVDASGKNFDVHDPTGKKVGYVTLLNEPSGRWGVWIDGVGAGNETFGTIEEAIDRVCQNK